MSGGGHRRRALGGAGLSLLVTAAIFAAGCGDDGATADRPYRVKASTTMTAASPPITRPRFVARVNRLCRRAWVAVVDNFADYSSWQEGPLSRRFLYEKSVRDSLLAGIDFHIFDEIRAVGSPPGDERRIERIIGSMQLAVELGQIGRWRAHSAAQVAEQFAPYNRRARRYGLADCLVDEPHLRRLHTS